MSKNLPRPNWRTSHHELRKWRYISHNERPLPHSSHTMSQFWRNLDGPSFFPSQGFHLVGRCPRIFFPEYFSSARRYSIFRGFSLLYSGGGNKINNGLNLKGTAVENAYVDPSYSREILDAYLGITCRVFRNEDWVGDINPVAGLWSG